jgi:hypothetical protein
MAMTFIPVFWWGPGKGGTVSKPVSKPVLLQFVLGELR